MTAPWKQRRAIGIVRVFELAGGRASATDQRALPAKVQVIDRVAP